MMAETEAPKPDTKEHWTVDKKVPIIVIVTIFGAMAAQGVAIVRYFGGLEARQTASEAAISELKTSDGAQDMSIDGLKDRAARIETDYSATKFEVSRRLGVIDDKLDRIIERLPRPTDVGRP